MCFLEKFTWTETHLADSLVGLRYRGQICMAMDWLLSNKEQVSIKNNQGDGEHLEHETIVRDKLEMKAA